jgi:type II secretory pathway pseudopilin PulG
MSGFGKRAAHQQPARRERGFTMVEMGVALLVLGLISVALVAWWRAAAQQRVRAAESDIMVQAQQAALGFAHANYRLPCPATDPSGLENCGTPANPRQVGLLPWRTLQLPAAATAQMRYGVYRVPQTSLWLDTDLAVAADRMRPLATDVGADITTVNEMGLGSVNLPDFCLALSLASQASATAVAPASALAVRDATASTAIRRPVAYVIAAPGLLDADGDGDRMDGLNHSASTADPTFEAGNKPVSSTYDDRVLALGFDTLFGNLQCGQALSAIQHSHANAALSASVMRRAISDYKYQLEVEAVLAGANVASATAGVALAAAGLANAIAALANATTVTVFSYGSAAGLLAASTAAVAVSTAAVVASAPPLALAIAVTVESAKRVQQAAAMMPPSTALAQDVTAHARAADAMGY